MKHPRTIDFVDAEVEFIAQLNEHITRVLSFPGIPSPQNLPQEESSPQVEAAATSLLGCLLALTEGDIEKVREMWPQVARGHVASFDAIRDSFSGGLV